MLPSPSWANLANEDSAKKHVAPRHAAPRAVYKPPKVGDERMIDGRRMIYAGEGARRGWVVAYDPEGDYGGPYDDACKLFLNKRYQSDMRDIYGLPFEPSKAEECRDPAHLAYWDRIRRIEDDYGFYIPPHNPRNRRSRNRRDNYFVERLESRHRRMRRREEDRRPRSMSRGRRSQSRNRGASRRA